MHSCFLFRRHILWVISKRNRWKCDWFWELSRRSGHDCERCESMRYGISWNEVFHEIQCLLYPHAPRPRFLFVFLFRVYRELIFWIGEWIVPSVRSCDSQKKKNSAGKKNSSNSWGNFRWKMKKRDKKLEKDEKKNMKWNGSKNPEIKFPFWRTFFFSRKREKRRLVSRISS